jgi:hypothetical protein
LYRITTQMRVFQRVAGPGVWRAACHPLRGMAHPLVVRLLVLVAALALELASEALAADPTRTIPDVPQIRTADPQVRALIDDAIAASPTVRALVARLDRSDVVVYVACERDPQMRMYGRMNFLSAAGGLRYVLIRLKPRASRAAAIATLAHELRHAVEVADTPAIVDDVSLERAYERMGYRAQSPHGRAFETQAAVEVSRLVHEELGPRRSFIVAAR